MSESAADEQHAQSVVLAVAEAAGDAPVRFDEAVDGLCTAVVRAAGVEVGEERLAPLLERSCRAVGSRIGQVGNERMTLTQRTLRSYLKAPKQRGPLRDQLTLRT